MTPSIPVAPKPEVQHLPTIFRRVAAGEIRIPAFQREFVWTGAQMLSLLDSVYRGFPISSLLFWRVNSPKLKTQDKRNFPSANEDAPFPHSFVLDGLQRLTTLYGVFNFSREQFDEIFDVIFDLQNEIFAPAKDVDLGNPRFLRLNHVFNPRSFLSDQKSIFELANGGDLVDRAIRLHSIFQEYMLPLVTIESESVEDVVRIFERINNTGTKLSSVDFMRAVTWSEQFDLTRELRSLAEHFEDLGFIFDDEALVKCVAVALGREPTAPSMLSLQTCSDDELHGAVAHVRGALERVVSFFRRNFGIESSDFIPYEAHIVVLAHLFAHGSDERLEAEARRWFLASAIDESLRGRSDAYVARLLRTIDDALDDSSQALFDHRIATPVDIFIDRRLIKGRALSAAAVMLFALRGARSLYSGELIPVDEYLRAFSPISFEPIFLDFHVGPRAFASHRRLANLVLTRSHEVQTDGFAGYLVNNRARIGEDVLASQFLTHEAIDALEAADLVEFAFARAESMMRFAESITDGSVAWPRVWTRAANAAGPR